MADKSKIAQRLLSDKTFLENQNHVVLGVFLAGSQNYGVEYENSDIDTKAILIPSFRDLCLEKRIYSSTHKFENGEQIDLKDIRSMFNCLLKQNINFLEILFTNYKVIDKEYWGFFNKIYNKREEIAHYDIYRALFAMYGDMVSKKSRLNKVTPATENVIAKYGYNPKEFHHIIRLEEFIRRYLSGESYQDCLISKKRDYLIDIKRNPQNYIDSYKEESEKSCESIHNLIENYSPSDFTKNEDVPILLEETMISIIKSTIKKELSEEKDD